jgi:hypothetical protein
MMYSTFAFILCSFPLWKAWWWLVGMQRCLGIHIGLQTTILQTL